MFTLEEIYGVNREEYCKITGITPLELVVHLEAEVQMLDKSYAEIAILYRESALSSAQLGYFEKLLKAIEGKRMAKAQKVHAITHTKGLHKRELPDLRRSLQLPVLPPKQVSWVSRLWSFLTAPFPTRPNA